MEYNKNKLHDIIIVQLILKNKNKELFLIAKN